MPNKTAWVIFALCFVFHSMGYAQFSQPRPKPIEAMEDEAPAMRARLDYGDNLRTEKHCTACKKILSIDQFYLRASGNPASECKGCISIRSKHRRANASEAEKERARKRRRVENMSPERVARRNEKSRNANLTPAQIAAKRASVKRSQSRPEAKALKSIWRKERINADLDYKLRERTRNRIYRALKRGDRAYKTMDLLGCDIETLKAHIAAQFRDGMTWGNYGPYWHIDHVRPCASFDLSIPENQKACFHYTNLQPLTATENVRKQASLEWNNRTFSSQT